MPHKGAKTSNGCFSLFTWTDSAETSATWSTPGKPRLTKVSAHSGQFGRSAVLAVLAVTDGRTANPRPLLPTNTPPLKSNRGLGLAVCHTNGLKTTPQSANGGYSGQTLEILFTNYPPFTIIKWSRNVRIVDERREAPFVDYIC